MEAYKLGLIDDKGTKVRNPITGKEKAAYNMGTRLIFNLKRLLARIPLLGKRLTATSAFAMLYLLREEYELTESDMAILIEELELEKVRVNINESTRPIVGVYVLNEDIASPKTGNMIARSGTKIRIEDIEPQVDSILGVPIYRAMHLNTNQEIFVSHFSFE